MYLRLVNADRPASFDMCQLLRLSFAHGGNAGARSFKPMNAPIHILVVDDEPAVRMLLRQGFELEGYAVSEAGSKARLLEVLDRVSISLITLDLELGQENGIDLACEIRAKHNIPIIMVTGKSAPDDRLVGLECGADDYITKPFHIREVLLRTRTVLNRYDGRTNNSEYNGGTQPERLTFQSGMLDFTRRELCDLSGGRIDLTDAELDLLAIFLRNPSRILSREELTQMIFRRPWSPLERAVDNHIARLRKKIEPPGDEPTLIKSVRGLGYVFTGDIFHP